MSDQLYQATEPATPFRRRQARRAGFSPRSAEVNAVLVLLAGLAMLVALCPAIFAGLSDLTRQMLSSDLPKGPHAPDAGDYTLTMLSRSAWRFLWIAAPACLILTGAILLGGLMQSGFRLSSESLEFKLERISVTKGFKRMFSARSAGRLAYNFVKLCLVGLVSFLSIRSILPELTHLTAVPAERLLATVGGLTLRFGLHLILILSTLAAVDYLLAGYFLRRDLRMSPEQLRQEQRDIEGSPLTRRRRSSLAMPSPAALASAILQADFVLTDSDGQPNPTGPRLALALQRCRSARVSTPQSPVRLLAKGSGAVARQIHLLAGQRGLPILNRPDLARALARSLSVNRYVPLRLYPQLSRLLEQLDASNTDRPKPALSRQAAAGGYRFLAAGHKV